MAEPSLAEIALLLGEIKGGMAALDGKVDQLGKDFRAEKEAARSSRGEIHRRLDAQAAQIHQVDKAVVIAGKSNAQTRDKIDGLDQTVKPYIEDIKRLRLIGWVVGGLLVLTGATITTIVTYAGDIARALVKDWLG